MPSEVGLLGGRGCAVNSSNEHRIATNGEGAHQDHIGAQRKQARTSTMVLRHNHYAYMSYEVPTNKY